MSTEPQAPIVEPTVSEPPSKPSPFQELPEELILLIIAHFDRPDLLLCSRVSRTLNRITIQRLLAETGTPTPTAYCKLVLDPNPRAKVDSLTVLMHSAHIKKIKDISFYYTSFMSYSSLIPPLRRTLHCLRSLSVEEVTLFFGTRGVDDDSKNEKFFKEVVPIFEDILNEIVLNSTKKLRIFGAQGLLGQYYQFRKLGQGATDKAPTLPKRMMTWRLSGAKDYLDRRHDKNSEDAIIQDDLRYSRTNVTGSRLFTRCTPEALQQTKLTHLNIGTGDFLRPPFSQWMFAMLRAAQIKSISFSFAHLSKDPEEVEFVLKRLASVLTGLTRLYLFEISEHTIPVLMKWINLFPTLERLQIEPFADTSFNIVPDATLLPLPYSFAPNLRRIDGPHQFLSYFFNLASNNVVPEAEDGISRKSSSGSPPTESKSATVNGTPKATTNEPGSGSTGGPSTTVAAPATAPPTSPFPTLELVHLDYYCVRGVKFHLHTLANAIRNVKSALAPPGYVPLAGSPGPSGNTENGDSEADTPILVHLKFDKHFRGLEAYTPRVRSGSDASSSSSTARRTLSIYASLLPDTLLSYSNPIYCTDPPSLPSPANVTPPSEFDPDAAGLLEAKARDLATLRSIEKVRVGLPGSHEEIIQGKFNERVVALASVFGGLKALRLVSVDGTAPVKEKVDAGFMEVLKEYCVGLKRVDVM